MKYFSNTAAKKVLVLVSPCGLMKAHQKWLWASSARKTLQELRGLCELEALSAILFVPLFLFLQIPVLSFPSLPSASVPNAVVEGTKCGWDAVRRANAHLPFHNMPCDFCVDYVKKKRGGLFLLSRPSKPVPGTGRGAVHEASSTQLSFCLFPVPFCSLLPSWVSIFYRHHLHWWAKTMPELTQNATRNESQALTKTLWLGRLHTITAINFSFRHLKWEISWKKEVRAHFSCKTLWSAGREIIEISEKCRPLHFRCLYR